MSHGPIPLLGDTWYAWGQGSDGDALTLQSTGLTLNGLTLFRIVGGSSSSDSSASLVNDGTSDLIIDDATSALLHDG